MSIMSCFAVPVHPRSFWSGLTGIEQRAFAARARSAAFAAGAVLLREGDPADRVMVIQSGWTKVCVDEAGRERVVALRGSGEFVGERAMLRIRPRSASVIALSPVETLQMSAADLAGLLADHPRILDVLERQGHDRRAEVCGRSLPEPSAAGPSVPGQVLTGEPVERRLAALVLDLVLREGADDGPLAMLSLPISNRDLASLADVPVRTVSRVLGSWHTERIIQASKYRIAVLDLGALTRIYGRPEPDPSPPPAYDTYDTYDPTPAYLNGPTRAFPRGWAGRNCSIVLTDIAAFGAEDRDDFDRQTVRRRMYELLRDAFEWSGVSWAAGYHEDRGDGVLIVVPPTVPTASIVDPLVARLAASLRRHNRQSSDAVRIQLRLALNVGPVTPDGEGVSGESIIQTARLVEAPVLKEQLAGTAADLGVIVSPFVYETVVKHGPGYVDPAGYQRVDCRVKESAVTAWMHLAGAARPPTSLRPRTTRPQAVDDRHHDVHIDGDRALG
jgi:CRP-like cAMP-binding protein